MVSLAKCAVVASRHFGCACGAISCPCHSAPLRACAETATSRSLAHPRPQVMPTGRLCCLRIWTVEASWPLLKLRHVKQKSRPIKVDSPPKILQAGLLIYFSYILVGLPEGGGANIKWNELRGREILKRGLTSVWLPLFVHCRSALEPEAS